MGDIFRENFKVNNSSAELNPGIYFLFFGGSSEIDHGIAINVTLAFDRVGLKLEKGKPMKSLEDVVSALNAAGVEYAVTGKKQLDINIDGKRVRGSLGEFQRAYFAGIKIMKHNHEVNKSKKS